MNVDEMVDRAIELKSAIAPLAAELEALKADLKHLALGTGNYTIQGKTGKAVVSFADKVELSYMELWEFLVKEGQTELVGEMCKPLIEKFKAAFGKDTLYKIANVEEDAIVKIEFRSK